MIRGILFLLIFWNLSAVAQTTLLKIPNDLSKKGYSVENAYAVVDDENDTFATFLINENSINAYLYSQNFEPISKFASKNLPEGYDEIIGKTIKDGQIRLFFKEYYNKKFGAVLFDFERGQSLQTEFGFKLSDEIYLHSHSYQDKFYILTVNKRSSILNVYTFHHTGKFEKKSFDFTENEFVNRKNKPKTLFHLLTEQGGGNFRAETSISKIQESNPNSIEITSNLSKFYDRESSFILTIDDGSLFTYLFEFKVSELSVELRKIENIKEIGDEEFTTNNSYLFEDKIFQIGGNKTIMILTVKDLETQKELKRLALSKDEEISFKNGPILQEGTSFLPEGKRELERTSQFLRKITSENIGVAVIATKNGYQITMGGNKKMNPVNSGPMGMGGFGGGAPMGNSGAVAPFNPVFFAYDSYKANKSTRIECLFDTDFQHIEGDIPQNVFDKIRDYTAQNPNAKAENIFRIKDFFVYGNYNPIGNTYGLFKFSE